MTPEPHKRVVDSPKIWATLLTNTNYLVGVLTLNFALKLHGTKYPLVVLYTDSLGSEAHEALDRRGILKERIEYLSPRVAKDFKEDVRFLECWTKLQVFALTDYERIILLDSDMIVLKNMDELMDVTLDITGNSVLAASPACVCNPMKKEHYPSNWTPATCGYTLQHANPAAAATEGPPNDFGIGMFNSGLLVLQPSLDLYKEILVPLDDPARTETYTLADQSLLSDVFSKRWKPLPYIYNALKTLRRCHKEIWRDEDVKNVHYILAPKPWVVRESEDDTHKWWWDANDQRLAEEKSKGIEDK